MSTDQSRHELFRFMAQVADEMSSEYERIHSRAPEDPGTAGDEGEGNWSSLLKEWLPAGYHVRMKGRIIDTGGNVSPQVDVVVLRPSYPPKLLDKKLYFAEGVAAAFECKLTVTAHHVAEAVETGAMIKRLIQPRTGSPYRELVVPPVYGLLAHSHSWKTTGSSPAENVRRALIAADLNHCLHPRETLDIVCVADLATWVSMRGTGWGRPYAHGVWDAMRNLYGFPEEGGVSTAFMELVESPAQATPRPVGAMFAALYRALGWEDPVVRPIADYFRLAGLMGAGEGAPRLWPWSVYSEPVALAAQSGSLLNGPWWEEWSLMLA